MSETIGRDGVIRYRTRLFSDWEQADRFRRCLEANPRFVDPTVCESGTSKTVKWFVTFRPGNRERQLDMYERQWDARRDRGWTEGLEYIFWQDPDHPGSWWCFNPRSGETYEVTIFSCTCPDYVYRCHLAALQCKHMQAWEAQSELGLLQRTIK